LIFVKFFKKIKEIPLKTLAVSNLQYDISPFPGDFQIFWLNFYLVPESKMHGRQPKIRLVKFRKIELHFFSSTGRGQRKQNSFASHENT
jgi:hypothetical protein